MRNFKKTALLLCLSLLAPFAHSATPDVFYDNASQSPIFNLLKSAKSSIDIEIYEIQDTQVQGIILKAMDHGVKVRVIQESEAVGSNCPVFDVIASSDPAECRVQKSFIQKVISKGGTYVPFADHQFCSSGQFRCLEHGKMIIIDGQKVLISTGNFNPTNLCDPRGLSEGNLSTCNRDYSVVSTDTNVVSTLSQIFESDLKGNAYDLLNILKSKSAQKITVSPYSLNPLLQFINSAKKSILVQNQYLKNADMNAALIAASKRGVKVYVEVSSICSFGKPDPAKDSSAIDLWTNTFKTFDAAGVKSRIFSKQMKIGGYNGYLHAKAIVVDGSRAWVGSVNGSTQALTRNREFGIFMDAADQVASLVKFIISDFNNISTESWQESLVCKKD